ncbi:hypothetical protein GCM10007390_20730 [Persicitalea jodogahamensis]|uniref:DUF11 domain-containing protein n=1 Tax=Persicitalea jodogahamensis TaxID=402147 RepID=A0A8J3G9V7_9BACT|nr:hypothetical protein GCM10007390_20730 [Persicitalea jodogahamensis]
MFFISNSSLAEGTKQASPTSNTISALLSAPDLANGSYFNTSEDNRLYFSIKNFSTESLYFGFDWRDYSGSSANLATPVYYRIMNPDGTVALGPTLWTGTGNGKINTYAQAVAGPNINGSVPTGYSPLVFNPTVNGEYWIEYWLGTSTTNSTPITTSAGRIDSPLFDLTVANRTSPYAVQSGRLFSYKWGFVAVDPTTFTIVASANAAPSFYAYTDDRLVVRLQFATGFQPIAFAVAVNNYGVNDSGDRHVDRKSVNDAVAPSLPGGYMVFLQPPDASIYPVATDPGQPTFQSPIFEGCVPPYGVRFTLPANGDVRLLFDLNGVAGYQAGTADRILEGFDLLAGPNTIPWDGKNGLGVFIANNVSLNLKLTYLRGRFNFPLYDAEINKGGFTVTTISPASLPSPRLYWDDSGLTNIGTTCNDSQNNVTGSGLDNSLVGSVSPGHAWNGNGNPGQVIPAPAVSGNDTDNLQCNDYGNVRTINTFGWGQEKEVSATGVLGCPDLTLTKSVNNATPNKGGTVTFTVTAQNLGPITATNTVVTDVLPSGFTLVSAVPSVGTFTAPNWNVGNLAVGATPTLAITATVNCSGLYTNIASIASDLPDINPNNNKAFAVVTPRSTGSVSLTNTCPATTVNLTTQVPCNVPSGATLTWHTGSTATAANKVANPASVGAGTYYAAFEDATNNCYSPTTAYTVTIQSCNTDLSIVKSANTSTPNVGTNVVFTLNVTNNGPAAATGVSVNDQLPSGYTYVSDNGGGAYNSSTGVWTIGSLANSGTASLQITATVKPTGSYANTATVTGSQNDPNTANNASTNTPTPVPVADLSVTKTDGSATYTPGTTTTYTIVVSNAGPSNVTGATVADNAPAGTTISSWTAAFAGGATGTASGSGNISQTVSLPSGGSVTYTVAVAVPSSRTGNLVNTATVAAPAGVIDNNQANNSATDTDAQNSVADLAITKTDGSATYTPGLPLTYTIVVSNAGPSNVIGATVADIIPVSLTGVTWSSATAGTASVVTGATGSGNALSASVSIPAGAGNTVTFTVTGTVSAAATGDLVNTATVTAPTGVTDPTPANNSATDTDAQNSVADLAVTKTDGSATYTPGTTTTYTIVVNNAGPSNVTGATVSDNAPAGTTISSWTAAFAGGATGTASGSGNISQTVSLPSGGSITYTVAVAVPSSRTGNLANTATVTAPAGVTDNNQANNSATDTDAQNSVADLAITKTDGSAAYTPGLTVTYTIVVNNAGPSNVTGATVSDNAPAGTTISSWTAAFAGGAMGTASGSGNISQTVSLPSGGSVTYTVAVAVPSSRTGNLVNTATVAAPAGVTDPTPANNSATDTDTQNSVADLAITKTDGSATYTPGLPLTYTIVVSNAGPSNVTGAAVSDAIPIVLTNVTWTSATAGTASVVSGGSGSGNNLSASVSIPAGAGNTVTFTVTGTVSAAATGNLVNTATVMAPAGVTDNNQANNSATDTDTPAPRTDLSISKTVVVQRPEIGANVTFTLVVTNNGPSVATGVSVADLLPNGYSYVSSTLPGNYNSGTGVWTIGNLANGNSATLEITATINASGAYANTAIVSGNETDPNTANNTSTASVQAQILRTRAYLQGALFGVTYSSPSVVDSLMRDNLRVPTPMIPLTSPYNYWNPTVTANTIPANVLNATGQDAIVDWVFVELRDATNPAVIVSSRSALLQRDGDIVDLDGVTPLPVRSPAGTTYYVAVRHRNHLAVMTAGAVTMTTVGTTVDFRKASTPTYRKGIQPIHQSQVDVLQGKALWAGNALRDDGVIYQGTSNDVNPIYQQVIGASGNINTLPFYILKGYYGGDINMDGKLTAQGTRNDVEYIYQNVFKNHPGNTPKADNFIIQQQLPE